MADNHENKVVKSTSKVEQLVIAQYSHSELVGMATLQQSAIAQMLL